MITLSVMPAINPVTPAANPVMPAKAGISGRKSSAPFLRWDPSLRWGDVLPPNSRFLALGLLNFMNLPAKNRAAPEKPSC